MGRKRYGFMLVSAIALAAASTMVAGGTAVAAPRLIKDGSFEKPVIPTGQAEFFTTGQHIGAWKVTAGTVFTVVDETTGEPMPDPVGEALRRQGRRYLNDSAVLVSRTGDRRAIRDSAAPVRMAEGGTIGAVLVFQDNTHARALQKELAHSALHDSLTGLPNRKSFERALAEAILQARLESREHALCFVDLDRFKQVNDSAGHAAGDALLRKIGQAIRRGCRSQDFVARIGGDEFALLLADCTLAGARKVAQQVVDAIAAARFTWQGQTYEIGASIGLTLITAQSSHATVLLGEADAACYAAKNAGRNQVAVFSETEAGPRGFVKSA